MKQLPIIGVSGKIGSGKDTAASMITSLLREEGIKIDTKRFAFKVKQFVADIIGVHVSKLDDQNFKKSFLGPEWNYLIGLDPNSPWDIKQMTVREMLIRIGDGMREKVHEDIWVNALFADYKKNFFVDNWIIPDLRYPNEKNRIEKLAGVTIRINRPGIEELDHKSEKALDDAKFSYVITNDGSLEDLFEQVKAITYDIRDTKSLH